MRPSERRRRYRNRHEPRYGKGEDLETGIGVRERTGQVVTPNRKNPHGLCTHGTDPSCPRRQLLSPGSPTAAGWLQPGVSLFTYYAAAKALRRRRCRAVSPWDWSSEAREPRRLPFQGSKQRQRLFGGRRGDKVPYHGNGPLPTEQSRRGRSRPSPGRAVSSSRSSEQVPSATNDSLVARTRACAFLLHAEATLATAQPWEMA